MVVMNMASCNLVLCNVLYHFGLNKGYFQMIFGMDRDTKRECLGG